MDSFLVVRPRRCLGSQLKDSCPHVCSQLMPLHQHRLSRLGSLQHSHSKNAASPVTTMPTATARPAFSMSFRFKFRII